MIYYQVINCKGKRCFSTFCIIETVFSDEEYTFEEICKILEERIARHRNKVDKILKILIFLQILLNIFYKLSSLVYSITNNIFCQQQILIFFIFFINICIFAIFTLYTRAHAHTHTHILYIDNRKIIRFYMKKMVGISNHLISIKII